MVPICMDFWKHSVITPTLTNPNFCYHTMLSSHGIYVCIWRLEVNIKWPPQQFLHFWRQCFLLYLELSDWLLVLVWSRSSKIYLSLPHHAKHWVTDGHHLHSPALCRFDPHMYFMDWRGKKKLYSKEWPWVLYSPTSTSLATSPTQVEKMVVSKEWFQIGLMLQTCNLCYLKGFDKNRKFKEWLGNLGVHCTKL